MRRLPSIPIPYAIAALLAVGFGLGIYALKASETTRHSQPPSTAQVIHSTPNSLGNTPHAARSPTDEVSRICSEARRQAYAVPRPTSQDPASPQAIGYEKKIAAIMNRSLVAIMTIARSGQLSPSLAGAFAVEARGQRLVDAQIPVLERHDVSQAERLAAEATQLTAPADATIQSAGLGGCVG